MFSANDRGIRLCVGFLLATFSPCAWAQTAHPWQSDLVAKDVQAICAKADSLPWPQPAAVAGIPPSDKNCQSRTIYYGIGTAPDYASAYRCASAERAAGDNLAIGGSAVLMMIYANGYGVEKNLTLATKFACDVGGAPAEIEGRIEHLTAMKKAPAGKIDICDDVTSGFMTGQCASLRSDIAAATNKNSIEKIVASWPPQDRKYFADLNAKAAAYFNAHALNEIDLSGSGRAAFVIEEEDSLTKKFHAAVDLLDKNNIPSATDDDFAAADKDLNSAYAAAMKKSGNARDGIRQTQRLWLAYRDAWMTFAAAHFPALSPPSVETWLTRERISLIKNIPPDNP